MLTIAQAARALGAEWPHQDRTIAAIATDSRAAEPGCLFYSCYQDLADPNLFMFYEEYENQDAIAYHNQTAHRIAWWEKVQEVLAEPMEAKVLSNSDIQVIIIRD